jgi:hypothetical protein
LITALLAIYACSASSQEVTPKTDPKDTPASVAVANIVNPHFHFEYADSGINVYATRIFSQYQLDKDELITADNPFVRDVFQRNNLKTIYGSTSQTKDSKVPYVEYKVIFIGAVAEVAERESLEEEQETRRKERIKKAVINRIIGSVMHTATEVSLHAPLTPDSRPMEYVGEPSEAARTRAIRSEIFQVLKDGEQKNELLEGMGDQKIQIHSDDILFIADIAVGHKAFQKTRERSVLYFVLPKSMSGEVPIGDMLSLNYGPTFSAVLSRALIRAANIVLAPAGTVTKKTLAKQREQQEMYQVR